MGALVKAVVQLRRASGISADTVNNDFYWEITADEIGATQATALANALVSFYNDVHSPGTADLASFYSDAISRVASAHAISFYSLETPLTWPLVWGSPKQVRNWTLDAAAAGNNLPGEVAVVLTYHADLTDVPETQANPTPPPAFIRPAARRRGRWYLGPLRTQTISTSAPTNEPFPIVGFVNAMKGAATFLQASPVADADLVVVSGAEQTYRLVEGGWIDNAFDSQRRRGNASDTRTLWP